MKTRLGAHVIDPKFLPGIFSLLRFQVFFFLKNPKISKVIQKTEVVTSLISRRQCLLSSGEVCWTAWDGSELKQKFLSLFVGSMCGLAYKLDL